MAARAFGGRCGGIMSKNWPMPGSSQRPTDRGLIALYARLTVAGKAHNAARIACARKLLIYANTVVQRGTPWSERTLGA
jgi:hypothetical protein